MGKDNDFAVFAEELRAAPAKTRRLVSGALTRHTNRIAAKARATAPKDRPWLATKGIAHDTRLTARRVYTVLDPTKKSDAEPEGADVGFRAEFGTSTQAPQPFLIPAFEAEQQPFVADVLSIINTQVLP